MAVLTVQRPSLSGTPAALDPASAAGDSFSNSGHEFFRAANGGGATCVLTFDAPGPCNFGLVNDAHDLVVVVEAGATVIIGPFAVTRFNDVNQRVQVTYSSAAGLTVAAEAQA